MDEFSSYRIKYLGTESRVEGGMQDARAIANLLLDRFDATRFNITNIKINKMIYLIHGWYLFRKNTPLIRNHIEAWSYGPVIKSVYESFKIHHKSPITSKASHFDYKHNKEIETKIDFTKEIDLEFIYRVSDHYVKFSGSELVTLTHESGSPWHKIFTSDDAHHSLSNRIPNALIYEYFFLKHGGHQRH